MNVRVQLHGRTFIVIFNEQGEPIRIKERKYAEVSYWSAKHHKKGGDRTLVSTILRECEAKREENHNAKYQREEATNEGQARGPTT